MFIRNASIDDLECISKVEESCFPVSEACPREMFRKRLDRFKECFYLMFDGELLVSFIDGMRCDSEILVDEMYTNVSMHKNDGKWFMLMGVNTIEEYRGRGCAGELIKKLIDDCRSMGLLGVVLTAKRNMTSFYERLGFVNEGISTSTHGGEVWYSMRYII